MMTQRGTAISTTFTRQDLRRAGFAALAMVAAMTAIFALDLIPQRLVIEVGDVAAANIVAPRTESYVSDIETAAAKDAAAKDVPFVYDYSTEKAIRIAGVQLQSYERLVRPVDRA